MEQPGHIVFAYPEQPRDKQRPLRLHEIRDGHAHLLLSPLFPELPCRGIFFNNAYPVAVSSGEQERQIKAAFQAVPLLCIATRPPLDDPTRSPSTPEVGDKPEAERMKKIITRSNNWLEQTIFARLRAVLMHCDRKYIELNLAPGASSGNARRARFDFKQTDEALVTAEPWTIGFVIYLERLWAGGPDLLCVFGMSGPMTLLWCHFLANRASCREKLGLHRGVRLGTPSGQSRLVAAQIVLERRKFPVDAHYLSFAEDWPVLPLFDIVWPATTG